MSPFRRRRQESPPTAATPETFTPETATSPTVVTGIGLPSLHDLPVTPPAAQSVRAGDPPQVASADGAMEAQAGEDSHLDPPTIAGVEDPVEQVAPVARGGRNMVVASSVGIGLLALVVVAAWFDPLAFAALLVVGCIGASLEWRRALARTDRHISIVPIILAVVGMAIATIADGAEALIVALMVAAAGVVAWRVADERIENTMADAMASILTLMWIPFLGCFLLLMETADNGWQRVCILVIAVVGNDTGGLFSGMAFGRTKMAPRVSPKKTWEGFAGGLVLGTGAAAVASYFLYDGRWWLGAVVGLGCCLAAVLGDLAESAIKRDIQVKDMSGAIPGHGGIMDRLDSILVAAPVGYVIFALFLGAS